MYKRQELDSADASAKMNTTVKDRISADLQEVGIDISDSTFSIKIGADGQVSVDGIQDLSLIHILWCFPAMKMNLRQWSSCKEMVFVCVIWSFDDMGLGEQVILSDKESKGGYYE